MSITDTPTTAVAAAPYERVLGREDTEG
jgi:hypothetical protein